MDDEAYDLQHLQCLRCLVVDAVEHCRKLEHVVLMTLACDGNVDRADAVLAAGYRSLRLLERSCARAEQIARERRHIGA